HNAARLVARHRQRPAIRCVTMGAWIVRTGLANRRAATFENPGAIALGWAEVTGIGDLTATDRDALVTLLQRAGRSADDATDETEQLVEFRDDVAIDDLVVAPDARSGDVVVGTVTGDYAYDHAGNPYRHRRAVTWTARVKAADIPPALLDDTRGNVIVRR